MDNNKRQLITKSSSEPHWVTGKLEYVVPILITIATIALLWFFVFIDDNDSKQQQERSWQVATIPAVLDEYTPHLILYGTTESPEYTTLEATVSANVKKLLVREGDRIDPEELLIELDESDVVLMLQQRQAELAEIQSSIKTELERAESNKLLYQHELELLEIAKRDYDRQIKLLKQEAGTEAARDQAKSKLTQQELVVINRKYDLDDHQNRLAKLKAQLKRSQSMLEQVELDLQRTKVVSPYQGRVTKVNVATGDRVQNGEALIEIFSTEHVEVRAQIPANHIQTIRSTLDSGKTLEAITTIESEQVGLVLKRLAGKIERGRGGIDGLFELKSKSHAPTIGRSVELRLNLPKLSDVYKVPFSAVYSDRMVYLVRDGRMHGVPIKRVGIHYDTTNHSFILISSSEIVPGDRIIVTQLPNARSGLKVASDHDQ